MSSWQIIHFICSQQQHISEHHANLETAPRDSPNHHHELHNSHGLDNACSINGEQKAALYCSESVTFVDKADLGRGELKGPQEIGDLSETNL